MPTTVISSLSTVTSADVNIGLAACPQTSLRVFRGRKVDVLPAPGGGPKPLPRLGCPARLVALFCF